MPISEDEVRHIAKLARLGLEPAEVSALTAELNGILERVERLRAVDVEGVEPLAHVGGLHTVWREDVARPGLEREAALANAPDAHEGYFRVPRVVAHEEADA